MAAHPVDVRDKLRLQSARWFLETVLTCRLGEDPSDADVLEWLAEFKGQNPGPGSDFTLDHVWAEATRAGYDDAAAFLFQMILRQEQQIE